jgi:hypothetical protein
VSKRFLFSLLICAAFLGSSSGDSADAAPKGANCLISVGCRFVVHSHERGSYDWHLLPSLAGASPRRDPPRAGRQMEMRRYGI